MTQVLSQGAATDGASLADVTPSVGTRWLPHPDYPGEFVVSTNTIKGATPTQEALYYVQGSGTATTAQDWHAQAKVNAVAAGGSLGGAIGFAYNIDFSKFKTFYLARFASAALFELLKIDNGGTTTLGTATFTNTLTNTTDQWTLEIHNALGVHNVFWGFINGTNTQNYTLIATDTAPLTAGKFGIYGNGTTSQGFVVSSTNITAGFADTGTTATFQSLTVLSDSVVQPGGDGAGITLSIGSTGGAAFTIVGVGTLAVDVAISISSLSASGSDIGGSVTLSSLTADGEAWVTGLGIEGEFPPWTSEGTVKLGVGGSASATLPRFTSTAQGHYTRNEQTLQPLTAIGTGIQSVLGVGAASLPIFQGAAAGEQKGAGFAQLTITSLTVAGAGITTLVGTGSMRLLPFNSVAVATVGVGSFGSAALASLEAEGTGFVSIMGVGASAMPLFIAEARAMMLDGAVERIVAMNAGNGAVTEFDTWDFNSFATLPDGRVLAAGAAGIVVLEGDQDDTAAIAAYLETGDVDFGSEFTKRPTDAYGAYSTPGEMVLTVTAKVGKRNQSYDYDLPRGENEIESRKADLGRGFESRYFSYKLANRAGADFKIDALTVLAQVTGRRG